MPTSTLSRRSTLAALAGSGLLAACGSSDDPYTVLDAVRADANYSLLAEAVVAAGLEATLHSAGPFTLFAPSNAAFAALLSELGTTKDALFADKALLTAVLSYHVLGAEVLRAAVPVGRAITPVGGGFFKVEASGSALVITDGRNRRSSITATDERADNGVVHRIDKVLLPANRTIVQTAQALPDFSILVEAVVAAGLAGTLSGAGPFTVFAPTNTAFAALLAELDLSKDQLLADKALLTKVLTYHVLPARVLKAEVPVNTAITTVQGETFTVNANLQISDRNSRSSAIVATDVFASNGVIHVIDKVILPKTPTIAELAVGTPQFSILVEALTAANLVGAVSGPTQLTVFAPTNDAFAALLTELGLTKAQLLANTALLTKVLTYHVLPARVLKAEVPVSTAITTVQGETFTVNANLQISDRNSRSSAIVATDVFASNGVIHVIDKVILPKTPTIAELAVGTPQFSILVEALTAANLVGAVSGPTQLTVFAPTNDAFAALLTELGLTKAQLLANTALLTKVLTYHVVPGRVFKSEVPLNTPIATLQGQAFSVNAQLRITDANGRQAGITATDAFALNGLVHTLDRVILPL